jgi:hypothetical protein
MTAATLPFPLLRALFGTLGHPVEELDWDIGIPLDEMRVSGALRMPLNGKFELKYSLESEPSTRLRPKDAAYFEYAIWILLVLELCREFDERCLCILFLDARIIQCGLLESSTGIMRETVGCLIVSTNALFVYCSRNHERFKTTFRHPVYALRKKG